MVVGDVIPKPVDEHHHFVFYEKLGDVVQFQIPEGGMSVWTKFDDSVDMTKIAENAFRKGLYFSNGLHHDLPHKKFNSTRLGFASSTIKELEICVEILKGVM